MKLLSKWVDIKQYLEGVGYVVKRRFYRSNIFHQDVLSIKILFIIFHRLKTPWNQIIRSILKLKEDPNREEQVITHYVGSAVLIEEC